MASRVAIAGALAFLGTALAQFSGWESLQVNSTICTWKLPRATILRDTLYADGGEMVWFQGLEIEEMSQTLDFNPEGVILTLNLTTPFSLSDNQSSLFSTVPRGQSNLSSNGITPYYVDGTILSNDMRFFLYGGTTHESDAHPDPGAMDVFQYQGYSYNSTDSGFSAECSEYKLPDEITRYLAYGAGVNAPSENKAWYFSGLRAPDKGVIHMGYLKEETFPSNISDTLISVTFDEDSVGMERWENKTLPDSVRGRASASGVFIPVGERGILVFVGGVTFPDFASSSMKSENPAALKSESKTFMSKIDIYDIAADTWYQQQTSSNATPPILAQGCAVAQHAADFSSFNIYHYGGYEAIDPRLPFNDDVWILSLPSFKWVRAYSGIPTHARAGHRCVAPYPDQMMVLGGFTPFIFKYDIDCLLGGVIQLLNLTSMEWMAGYSPDVYGDYGVPKVVQTEIGGGFSGGATARSPEGGWDDEGLGIVFDTPYPTERITTWYPYPLVVPTHGSGVDNEDQEGGDDGGLPEWVPPTLGTMLGLVFVVTCGVAFLYLNRRIIKPSRAAKGSHYRSLGIYADTQAR